MLRDHAVAEDHHALAVQRAGGAAQTEPFFRTVGSAAGEGLGKHARVCQHEAKDVLGAGLRINVRTVRHHDAALRHVLAELRRVVAGEARGADLNPLQVFRRTDAFDVRLAKGDLRPRERRIRIRLRQHGRGGLRGKQQRVPRRPRAQESGSAPA